MKGRRAVLNGMSVEDSDGSLFQALCLAYSLLEEVGNLLSTLVSWSSERKLIQSF
jgi:hypothetical protein